VAEVAPLDPERIVTVLAKHGVPYVLIGALAARLQGFPRVTADADITPSDDRENLEKLAAAVRELGARVCTDGVPEGLAFDWTASALARAVIWNLVTSAGRLDIGFRPSGTDGYDDLSEGAIRFEVFGVDLDAARLEDIVRSERAAHRPQDRQDVIVLEEMLRPPGQGRLIRGRLRSARRTGRAEGGGHDPGVSHSARIAVTGSTRPARRAGSQHAASAVNASAAVMPAASYAGIAAGLRSGSRLTRTEAGSEARSPPARSPTTPRTRPREAPQTRPALCRRRW
jgi:hypothetical protein